MFFFSVHCEPAKTALSREHLIHSLYVNAWQITLYMSIARVVQGAGDRIGVSFI